MNTNNAAALRHLGPAWFSIVMGLCGLSLAWHRAAQQLGEWAHALAWVSGGLALLVFVLLALGSVWRWMAFRDAVREDLQHPVRHAFFAAVPVSVLLLATVGLAMGGPRDAWHALWWVGSVAQVGVTAWVLGRWLSAGKGGAGALWPGVTPVLLIPIVGNVVVPLAGVALGHPLWSAAQLGIGLFFWPIVVALVLARRIAHSPLPDRLLPAWVILLAPPSVIALAGMQLQLPPAMGVMLWGVAAFSALWLLPLVPRMRSQAFGLPWWAFSFPLAAFATLTGRLAERAPDAPVLQWLAWLLLAVATLVIAGLSLATLRGLWRGELLVPEPVPGAPAQGLPGEQAAKP
ncbi:MAG: SLAC1 anion channel family protein [Hydrogenophaga sp.]|uniref:SLAC1 anion channel family protein n=1 Tax=Hydrogenophaga sp. TaxID=1904254 RepID=UPI001D2F664C|nr:SLAC1 anion channel family protein [Hydrogenophaga sp.]MBX3609023.1 SLAC1 anion channel family protein [Hydrogenophaga sp.]